MAKHLIHQQQIVLHLPHKERVQTVQNAVSNMLLKALPARLETALDELAPRGEVVRIDALQLHLGEFSSNNLEKEFGERLIAELKNAIQTAKTRGEKGTAVTNPARSSRDAFIHFLQKGSLPWYMPQTGIATWEAEMRNLFSGEDWQYCTQWLLDNGGQNEVVIQRLANQFSDGFLQKLLQALLPNLDWPAVYTDLLPLFSHAPTQQEAVRQQFWISIFTTRLLQTDSVKVVGQLLKTLAERLHLPLKNFIADTQVKTGAIQTPLVQEAYSRLQHELEASAQPISESVSASNAAPPENDLAEGNLPESDGRNKEHNIAHLPRQETGRTEEQDVAGILTKLPRQPAETAQQAQNGTNKMALPTDSRQKATGSSQAAEVQYVSNCGIMLLHPFLEMYFTELELVQGKQFTGTNTCQRAVLLLHYLATGQTEAPEFDLLFQKLCCGLPFGETLPGKIKLTEKEVSESAQLLQSVINYWSPLKNTSAEGLQQTFLQRKGKLEKKENGWLLTVEQQTVDILLSKLPWGFSTIRLPWMDAVLNVEWV